MKKGLIIFFILINTVAISQTNFDNYFVNKTLRIDYIIGNTKDKTNVYFEQMKEEPFWGGSKNNLIDKFNFGDFRVMVYDSLEKTLIYSRGYSTLYPEWLDTELHKTINRSFYESVTIPFPKHQINVKIQMRGDKNKFYDIMSKTINPKNYFIIKDKYDKYQIEKIHYSGNYNKKLDIVIIPEGYTKDEMTKFKKDCKRFVDYFFEVEPFKKNKDKVNFWSVNAPSEESGTDIPGKGIWKNTLLNTHFYTFDIERYLTTQDYKKVKDVAAYAPYDQIYILVNTKTYGGGGVYNYYNLCMSDHNLSAEVFTHEFGHAFAALADEYQYGYTNASEIYDMTIEPWQVNITNLVDLNSKWGSLVDKNTPIPTPSIEKYNKNVGAFEGAGYVKKKMYRPTKDCKMRSNATNDFCPVCYKTVLEMLLFYAE